MFGLAIGTIIVTILHSYVSAQATCEPGLGYTLLYNSLNQTPCTMAMALGGACSNGVFTLGPLQSGYEYIGPSVAAAQVYPCECSTVYYSLLSACGYCQNEKFLGWKAYSANCTTVYNQVFPAPIPPSTKIPHYAYLDVVTNDTFSPLVAEDTIGVESTAVPQGTSTTGSSTTGSSTTGSSTTTGSFTTGSSTTTGSFTTMSAYKQSKSDAGAIAGGVIGGVVFLGSVAGLVAFIIMRRRKRSNPHSVGSPETVMGYRDASSMGPGKVYDPNDHSTFPPLGYSPYSASQTLNQSGVINPICPGNPTAGRTQYTGVPEL